MSTPNFKANHIRRQYGIVRGIEADYVFVEWVKDFGPRAQFYQHEFLFTIGLDGVEPFEVNENDYRS